MMPVQDELIAAGGVPYLVQVLAASSATLKIYAANALRNCAAASAAGRELVENSGAIPILVKQLSHKWWPSNKTVQVRCTPYGNRGKPCDHNIPFRCSIASITPPKLPSNC